MLAYLLDVNLLIALADPMHVHHDASHKWFEEEGQKAWATCPLTENGFIRVASHPNYPNSPGDFPAVFSILRQACEAPGHHFWTEDLSTSWKSLDLMRSSPTLKSPTSISSDWLCTREASWLRWISASRLTSYAAAARRWS